MTPLSPFLPAKFRTLIARNPAVERASTALNRGTPKWLEIPAKMLRPDLARERHQIMRWAGFRAIAEKCQCYGHATLKHVQDRGDR